MNTTKPDICEHCGGRRPLEGADAEALLDSIAHSATPEEMKKREEQARAALAFVMTPKAERQWIGLKPPTRQQILNVMQEIEREHPHPDTRNREGTVEHACARASVNALRWVLSGDYEGAPEAIRAALDRVITRGGL